MLRRGARTAGGLARACARSRALVTIPGVDGSALQSKCEAFLGQLRACALPRLAPIQAARPSLALGGDVRARFRLDVYPCGETAWRNRAEFRVWHDKAEARMYYVMFVESPAPAVEENPLATSDAAAPGADAEPTPTTRSEEGHHTSSRNLRRKRRKKRKRAKKHSMQRVEIVPGQFTVGDALINELMATVLDVLNGVNHDGEQARVLADGIMTVGFRSALDLESPSAALVTLVYRRPLDEETWAPAARALRNALRSATSVEVNIVGRARKQMVAIDLDYVEDRLTIERAEPLPVPMPRLDGLLQSFGMWPQARNERTHFVASFEQPDAVFSQPNARIAQEMMSWVVRVTAATSPKARVDAAGGAAPEWRRIPASTLLEM